MSQASRILPILLSGGTGTRLWPLSREAYPKQLLPLASNKTMLQETVTRVLAPTHFDPPLIIAHEEHRFIIAEQLRSIGISNARIILEPQGRNTAPAAAVAMMVALHQDPEALILLMPADHVIRDVEKFRQAVALGAGAATKGQFVLFGMKPIEPATGYGYIKMGDPHADIPSVHAVEAFVEKPDQQTAERYVSSNKYLWNSGIFLLPARELLAEFKRLEPDILTSAQEAFTRARHDMDFLRLDAEAFSRCRSISIDHAIMERTQRSVIIPAEFDWTDVGSWSALWDISPKEASGNVILGDVIAEDVKMSYLRSEGPMIAALGVEDIVVVATKDAVLIASKQRDQDVKGLVERLRAEGRKLATETVRVYRPWGFYESIHDGERFQVKRITVNPGGKLSLQKHFHRAEHWVVVNGTALVTRDQEKILLRENESVFLPLGCVHRLENPGRLCLNLIEVQSGPYLGEDDIVRIEDVYERQ
ncbi:mannose-1-phosphate guanylyltransferase/mannose-6-phosphate isomerase [Microvirga aerilata]|uniref:mannose-1-phosphate guanylyltransferase n=1 Tax=Microvirga aerilata TaxID=670292 RepID=A0A937CZ20_9HYPH|nr:mannose-1-phosphate guanylyltransferase/mannose-6-phosphate isomerase [Microvirga aerilata]MBL0407683.1 mannose-1-phosphate guanylyltransferase/mannose-6-phosphate isomerase [Microvirga aerilata]